MHEKPSKWSEERRFATEEEANEYVKHMETLSGWIVHPINGLLVNYSPEGGGGKPWTVVVEAVL